MSITLRHPRFIHLNRGPTRITTKNVQRMLFYSLKGAKIKPVRSHSSNSGILPSSLTLLILILVHSFRQSDLRQYTAALMAITPSMFALDRTNYSQWLPVHVRDMVKLPNKHPHVYKEFWKGGKFTGQKRTNTFSSIPLDQAHEQNNKLIKGDGRIIEIPENPGVLLRWMVAGPELARMVKEFETTIEEDNTNQTYTTHHEQSRACQVRFISHVQSLVST